MLERRVRPRLARAGRAAGHNVVRAASEPGSMIISCPAGWLKKKKSPRDIDLIGGTPKQTTGTSTGPGGDTFGIGRHPPKSKKKTFGLFLFDAANHEGSMDQCRIRRRRPEALRRARAGHHWSEENRYPPQKNFFVYSWQTSLPNVILLNGTETN